MYIKICIYINVHSLFFGNENGFVTIANRTSYHRHRECAKFHTYQKKRIQKKKIECGQYQKKIFFYSFSHHYNCEISFRFLRQLAAEERKNERVLTNFFFCKCKNRKKKVVYSNFIFNKHKKLNGRILYFLLKK